MAERARIGSQTYDNKDFERESGSDINIMNIQVNESADMKPNPMISPR